MHAKLYHSIQADQANLTALVRDEIHEISVRYDGFNRHKLSYYTQVLKARAAIETANRKLANKNKPLRIQTDILKPCLDSVRKFYAPLGLADDERLLQNISTLSGIADTQAPDSIETDIVRNKLLLFEYNLLHQACRQWDNSHCGFSLPLPFIFPYQPENIPLGRPFTAEVYLLDEMLDVDSVTIDSCLLNHAHAEIPFRYALNENHIMQLSLYCPEQGRYEIYGRAIRKAPYYEQSFHTSYQVR